MALGWVENIEKLTVENETFRTVLHTGKYSQLTVMTLQAGEEIGNEVHEDHDQFIRIEEGMGKVTFGPDADTIEEEHPIEDDFAIIIPAGTWHNVVNTSEGKLKLYSIYSPAEHPDGTVHLTKADGDAAEAEHHRA